MYEIYIISFLAIASIGLAIYCICLYRHKKTVDYVVDSLKKACFNKEDTDTLSATGFRRYTGVQNLESHPQYRAALRKAGLSPEHLDTFIKKEHNNSIYTQIIDNIYIELHFGKDGRTAYIYRMPGRYNMCHPTYQHIMQAMLSNLPTLQLLQSHKNKDGTEECIYDYSHNGNIHIVITRSADTKNVITCSVIDM